MAQQTEHIVDANKMIICQKKTYYFNTKNKLWHTKC